jgi:hypothetical protein
MTRRPSDEGRRREDKDKVDVGNVVRDR